MSTPSVEIVQHAAQPVAPANDFMPIMSIEVAAELRENIVAFVRKIMVQDQDFGVIPGTSSKPVLLKPGAEKLCSFFGLEPEFTVLVEEADWTGENHGGEPFYYVRYHCRLRRNGVTRGVGEGSCNSWESRYRYRNANRKCPSCGQEAIIVGKQEYGGGFVCFKKKGGCGAKYDDNDPRMTEQVVGRVANPDVADQVNTIQKMAQKRALVPATLLATSGSEFFTQDLEDSPAPEPIDHRRNTPEEQKAFARQRINEVRGDGQPAASVPGPLQAIVESMQKGKPGGVRQGFDFLKAQLKEALPANGEAEYKRIIEKYQLVAGSPIKHCVAALIEMWETGEFARERAREASSGEPEQGALLPEVVK